MGGRGLFFHTFEQHRLSVLILESFKLIKKNDNDRETHRAEMSEDAFVPSCLKYVRLGGFEATMLGAQYSSCTVLV